jgi:hypothetical protein
MSDSELVYKWDSTKLMSNCAFAIVKLQYSVTANVRGLEQLRIQVINPRKSPGDCFSDYLSSSRYGAALTSSQIDSTSNYVEMLVPMTLCTLTAIDRVDWSNLKIKM